MSTRKILVVLAIAVIAGSLYRYRQAQSEPSFFYEFGVDVAYGGKDLAISRVVACIPPSVGWRTFPALGRSQEAIAETLEDGSGLIIVIPNLCDGEAWPVIPDYVPLMLWTADAKDPKVLEALLSEDLLRSGKGRLILKRAFAQPSTREKFVGASRDFVQFSYGGSDGNVFKDYHTKGKLYTGLTARVVPRSEWLKVAETAQLLTGMNNAGIVPSAAMGPIERSFPFMYDVYALMPQPIDNYSRSAANRRAAFDSSVSLRWVNGAFEVDNTTQGRALAYSVDQIPTIHLAARENREGVIVITTPPPPPGQPNVYNGSMAITWPLRVGDVSLEVGTGAIYFEPISQQIIAICGLEFFLYENPK